MNKNRNKIAAMMMVAAITVSSVAMPVEAIALNTGKGIAVERNKNIQVKAGEIKDVAITEEAFPDEEFRNKVIMIANQVYEENPILSADKIIETTELDLYGLNIGNLKGIENFKNLKVLDCSDNNLKSLDLSKNTLLETLIYSSNNVSTIDLSNNINLKEIYCSSNGIESIDISKCSELETFCCLYDNLKSIDVSQNKKLKKLYLSGNEISNINLSNNKLLEELDLACTKIESLDISHNNKLKELTLGIIDSMSSIKKINFGNINSLKEIYMPNSYVESLDLKNMVNLEKLNCENNPLGSLDVRNNIKLKELSALNCQLSNIDISNNKELESLDLTFNKKLSNIDISENKKLKSLGLGYTQLSNIDISKNNLLENLSVWHNENLKDIDLSNNTGLKSLNLSETAIKDIDLSNNTKLEEVSVEGLKNIKSLDLTKQPLLTEIRIGESSLGYVETKSNQSINENVYEDGKKSSVDIKINKNIKSIDLNDLFKGIDGDKIKVKTKGVNKNGTVLNWEKIPSKIIYTYDLISKNNAQIEITLNVGIISEPINPPTENGGGATNPDQKPEEKPNEKPNKKHEKIIGSDRYETAAKIADKMGSYNTVILVNSDKSMADGLSAASLSGKKNAPILLVKQNKIPKATMDRINKANNVYIVGGENAISKNVEKKLKESGKKINRIAGKDRYDTSREIAKLLGGYDKAFIVNGAKGEADAMSVSAVAAKYGAPILLTNGKTSIHDKKSGVKYYAIGGTSVIDNKLKEKYSAERVAGSDRYATNREIMDEFYWNSEKVYFAKGDTLIDALTASALAKDNGIVLVSKNKNHSELEGKDTVQVGGMNFEIDFE